MNKPRQKSRKKMNLGPTVIYDKSLKLDEYLGDKTRINLMANRSCYFSPDMKDFGQFTESSDSTGHKSGTRRSQEIEDSIECVKGVLYNTLAKDGGKPEELEGVGSGADGWERRASSPPKGVHERELGSNLRSSGEMVRQSVGETCSNENISIKDVRISKEPQIKIVAEKFSRYKRNDVEIRKLEGRLVCVEYDVHLKGDKGRSGKSGPVQVLRAYFALAPGRTMEDDVKNKEMGIEIIDAKIPRNKVYMEDLKRFLKRKQNNRDEYDQAPLNPKYLYNLAKRDVNEDISFTGLISKVELDEIKNYIMKKTASSVHGINRRKLRPEKYSKNDTGEDIIIEQILKFM